ncbi:Transposon Tf2-9 polyprotein [Podosphaera aphanis]|nr:Transposon Tf2-9 polyprotein [Podosphaera aphanis]
MDTSDAKAADLLPPHRSCDHQINLKSGTSSPSGPLYNMSVNELRVLRKWLDDNLTKGFIRPSTSPAASPVLFAKKPGGGLRFCVDYRGLNAITIKNRYPLPLLQETRSRLSTARYFTKLDVNGAFNQICMAEGHEYLTAFNTRYSLFESLVMPFRLTNAPATFQARINKVLRPFLDITCTAYIDDVLIYSDSIYKHKKHVNEVLEALGKSGFKLDIKKCEFDVQEVVYLGLIISTSGIRMDPRKVECITHWKDCKNTKYIQAFLGFANFYRRFIKGFSKIVRPLVALTKRNTEFNWSQTCLSAFNKLKRAFTTAPILAHFDPVKQNFLETDASDYVSSGILSQRDEGGILHPVAFLSKKFDPAECNYEVYDKELLAIMRWNEFLCEFDFRISYRPGKLNIKPDALTRRSRDLPENETDEPLLHQNQILLKPELFVASSTYSTNPDTEVQLCPTSVEEATEAVTSTHKISRLLEEGYKTDQFWLRIRKKMTKASGIPHSKEVSLSECKIDEGRLFFRDRLYVPDNDLRILLQSAHDSCESGHPGKNKLFEVLSRDWWWPNISQACSIFAKNCHSCRRNQVSKSRYQGAPKPLPPLIQRWREISVDYIGPLPSSDGFNFIMVVVDRLSKERHYSACLTTMNAQELARIFIRDIYRLHGLPDFIVSDRGAVFVAEFWEAACHCLQINISYSTAYHPETDGQTENANAFLEQYLRHYINFAQNDWNEWLPMAEFAANDAVNASTSMSPFFANKRFHPR